tara:strand:- start:1998 stop:2357 length:360 start_codon:yes stop_codon:yes gene_type:complete
MVQPGLFRYTTTINLVSTGQQTDFGDYQKNSVSTQTRFAAVKWLPGTEQVINDVVGLVKNIEFTYRYESLIDELNRIDTISYDSTGLGDVETFKIKSIEHKGAGNKQLIVIKAHYFQNA